MDVGVVVQNVATCHAIHEAVSRNIPLIERITTVTGSGVGKPCNLRVRIGTPASALLERAAFDAEKTKKLIYGGPMTGPAHFDTSLPVNKGMGGILALTDPAVFEPRDCIRCGRCVDACPMHLVPSEISILGERGEYLATREVDILDCIECGACTYICPARRPIVQWIKAAKGEIARERAEAMAKKT
jgi:electron transport complex protein RnfC